MIASRVSLALLALVSICLMSCVKTCQSSTNYVLIVDETTLKNDSVWIRKFFCEDLAYGEKSVFTPSFNSRVQIVRTSGTDTCAMIVNRTGVQKFAQSDQTWQNYRMKVKDQCITGWTEQNSENRIDSERCDKITMSKNSLYLSCTNKGIPSELYQKVTSRDSFFDVIKEYHSQGERIDVIYLDITGCTGLIVPHDGIDSLTLKRETYNTIRAWYDNLSKLYTYIENHDKLARNTYSNFVKDACTPNCTVEIKNINKPIRRNTIDEYLDRLNTTDDTRYDDVRFILSNYHVIKDYEERYNSNSEFPQELASKIALTQGFEAINNGRIVYSDSVNKQINVVAKKVSRSINGIESIVYEILIERISVVSTQ